MLTVIVILAAVGVGVIGIYIDQNDSGLDMGDKIVGRFLVALGVVLLVIGFGLLAWNGK